MIEVQSLTRVYGRHVAVDSLSFRVARGEIVGFLGPNGAGKTTTMRMLTCFLPPSSGTARVAGFDIAENSIDVRRRVGYLPESVPLYGDLTVLEYLHFVATLKEVASSELSTRVNSAVESCGVGDVRTRRIGELSRGYRQRVGIAQAIVSDPDVLIFDEPTVGLDPGQIIEIRDLIRAMAGERTVVLSSHILPEVSRVCDRVIIINRGRLVLDRPSSSISFASETTTTLCVTVRATPESAVELIESIPGVFGVQAEAPAHNAIQMNVACAPGADPRGNIASALVNHGFDLLELSARTASLEDVFVRLVSGEDTGL